MMYQREIELYLKSYPEALKWINECLACHHRGYKPNMPKRIGGKDSVLADNLRRYFSPMEVDEMGFCVVCSKLQNREIKKISMN